MANSCDIHDSHSHKHGPGCGHTSVEHEGHTDYLHDGHMHHVHGEHVDEHRIAIGGANPSSRSEHNCGAHDKSHKHGPGCGHEPVPHGDHVDYIVSGHLHHGEGGQCHDHGPIRTKPA